MLSRAVLLLAVLSAALSAEVPESHIMHVPRHGLPQQVPQAAPPAQPAAPTGPQTPAEERSLKLIKHAPLLTKLALKPKFPFGFKEKFPFGLKKKLPAFLGGTAAAAAATGAAGAAGAGGLGALGIQGLDFSKLSSNDAAILHQYPVWKVHRYNGIDLRPVRLGAPGPSGPYPAAAPAAPYPAEEPKQVYGPPPKEVSVPEPVYGPPAEAYGPPAETYGPPAEAYGPPADIYGPPAQTYGPPAETYGPPAEVYGPPAETYGPPAGASAEAAPGGDEGLEALSQLGALTDFLPGGGSGSGSGPLASLGNLGSLFTSGRSKGEIFSTLSKLKQNFPEIIKSAVGSAPAPAPESAVYHPPAPSGIHGLFKGHPLFSKFANGFSGAGSHVPLPPLPELPTLPEIKGLKEIPGIPALPHIKLPTKYIAQGGPYVSVRYPTQPASAISPRGQQLPIPAAAPTFALVSTTESSPHRGFKLARASQGTVGDSVE
ncbi:transcription initiation factor TFIID subunit 4-like [Frankliniella occidentalis]|uniref:Transcription initiation factor TFIID subunit 4-like n=1 Tax=Frankliniella occidentalis TaxID=133901 RepID=A0A9C6WZ05_FRAOC|nr:transcription initiation factor TFIID subunit 4-like [Frankliniella occidentalis]